MHFLEKEVPMQEEKWVVGSKGGKFTLGHLWTSPSEKPTRHKIERVKDFYTSLFLSQKVRPSIMQVRKLLKDRSY